MSLDFELRRFNDVGIQRFRDQLNAIRLGHSGNLSDSLLTDAFLTDKLEGSITLEKRIFDSKGEIIGYLSQKLSAIPKGKIFYDTGMWTWIAALYFDSICPLKGGKRKVREDSKYILNTGEWTKYYRHLLASLYRLRLELGDLAAVYLTGAPDTPGDLFEQLASRQEIATCKGIIEAVTIMYLDPKTGKIKRGVRNKDGAGVLRRFIQATIPQFQMTYDLNSMTGEELIALLPKDYEKWIETSI